MLTLRAAAGLLAQSDSLLALRDIARQLGFTSVQHVSREARRELGIHTLVTDADIASTSGRLRCLSVRLAPATDVLSTTDARELTRRVCLAILAAAPARDWCVLALDAAADAIVFACVTAHPTGPRIAALRVDRKRVVDSDADTLRSLASVAEPNATLRHARFSEILGRDALSTRFYRALEASVTQLGDSATGQGAPGERRELALLCASRCLFLAFLEAKGWLNHDRQFLVHHLTHQLEHRGHVHERFLRPLFFGTLNTPLRQRATAARAFGDIPFLNGGLFSPTALERKRSTIRFSDDALATLMCDVLDRFRFTAHEDSTRWSEAAVDPEMLGRAFESLMAEDERHRSGSYYTPPTLVETVVLDALVAALPDIPPDALASHDGVLHVSARSREHLRTLRVLDPACGSGAFLVHTLERLASLHARMGDQRPIHTVRRELLTQSIFGVDRNPMAVWLCELRLWLSIVIDCPETRITHIPPLPNLDHHIRLGDTLAGGTFSFAPPSARRLTALRERYTRATGRRKHTLAAALDRDERQRAVAECQRMRDHVHRERAGLLTSLRTRDLFGERSPRTRAHDAQLRTLRNRERELNAQHRRLQLGGALPFRFAAHFADVAGNGGFQLVIGNPPWVRPHALPNAERLRLRVEYRSMRNAAWRAGAKRAGAGAGFAAQADLSAAFIERSVQLLAPDGIAALLVPAKLWRALAGGGIREWLAEHADVRTVRDWSQAPALFGASVYPSLVVAQRRTNDPAASTSPSTSRSTSPVHVALTHATGAESFTVPRDALSLNADPGAPWILLPAAVRDAFERLRSAGPALGDSSIGRPMLGVKCGCNAAFLVHAVEHDDDTATVSANGRRAIVERRMLRPAMRGDGVHAALARRTRTLGTRSDDGALRILWTHSPDGEPMRTLPPAAARWLSSHRSQLERRKDARARQPWWTLFRTESARYESARVVWADIGKRLRPRVLPPGDPTVPLNTCYVLRTPSLDDAWAVAALLGSPVARAWFDVLAEPARGGFRRFMGWTVATLPVPDNWLVARIALADFARRQHARLATRDAKHILTSNTANASAQQAVNDEEYVTLIADAYGIPVRHLEPLVRWTHS